MYSRLVAKAPGGRDNTTNIIRDAQASNDVAPPPLYPSPDAPPASHVRRILIRSDARDPLVYPNAADFRIRLKQPLKNVIKVDCTGGAFQGAVTALPSCLFLNIEELSNYEDVSGDSYYDTTFPLVVQGHSHGSLYVNNQALRHTVVMQAPRDSIHTLTVSVVDPATGNRLAFGQGVEFIIFLEVTSFVPH